LLVFCPCCQKKLLLKEFTISSSFTGQEDIDKLLTKQSEMVVLYPQHPVF